MHTPDPESPEAFAKHVRASLLKGFAIPVATLAFFLIAPVWLEHNLHEAVNEDIEKSTLPASEKKERGAFFAQLSFEAVGQAAPAGLEGLRQNLDQAGITGQFARLRWGQVLAALLCVILVTATIATFALNRRAKRSRENLIAAYRLAWRIGIGAALAKVVLLIPLLAYGTFELSTLATDHYFPKLILVIVIGGLIALWRSAAILIKPVPMEFRADLARAVTPTEAPRLWADVRAAALRLGTAPPDHILVGMEHNFYVTELAVNYDGGQATGRTLYLSLPLMRQLSPIEVTSIIGHELGHFRGEDTRVTREFYPLRWRANATLQALAGSGWVGWTSVHSLLFFHGSFGRTEQSVSREREFLADRAAAELTSPSVTAAALTKVHVYIAAFERALGRKVDNPFTTPLQGFVRSELADHAPFWEKLLEAKSPHPLDSHPPLRDRLNALGEPADIARAKALASAESETAFTRWFTGREGLFTTIEEGALDFVRRAMAARADYATSEGRQLLDEHFPEIRWPVRKFSYGIVTGLCVFNMALFLFIAVVVDELSARVIMAVLIAACAWAASISWRRHRGGQFTLRPDSLDYTGWTRPLLFAEVESITTQSSYGVPTLNFRLKSSGPGRWKHSLFNGIKTRTLRLNLSLIPGKPADTLKTIARYITRDLGT